MEIREIPIDYPRPQMYRPNWISLNGVWEFDFDDKNNGLSEQWYLKKLKRTIVVPFCYQSRRSGINDPGYHPYVWYQKKISLPTNWEKKTILLHFGAVDENFTIWIDGKYVGSHSGGHTASTFVLGKDIDGKTITVRVTDEQRWDKPLGKQSPTNMKSRCWYTPTTGIWQTVWMEAVEDTFLSKIQLMPDLDRHEVSFRATITGELSNVQLRVEIFYQGNRINAGEFDVKDDFRAVLSLPPLDFADENYCWSPESPNLFDAFFTIKKDGHVIDEVQSYFGMRTIEISNGQILLNRHPVFLHMVLDQGYWEDSLMTPPEDKSLMSDVQMIKDFGFNGVRKHQKIEDDRFYYWADKLGLIVTAEMPSSYQYSIEGVQKLITQWIDAVDQLINHPCIIAWVPMNESWGVRDIVNNTAQQHFADGIYELTKAIDPSRLVSTNDGWEQVRSDLCCIHDYFADANEFRKKYADIHYLLHHEAEGRSIYSSGYKYEGQPILISEYGGIAFGEFDKNDNWGYHEKAENTESYLIRIKELTRVIEEKPEIIGYCYTQLTDVQQEVNGLAYSNHKPKVDPEGIYTIFHKPE